MPLRIGVRLLAMLVLSTVVLAGDVFPHASEPVSATETRVELLASGDTPADLAAALALIADLGGRVEVTSHGRVQAMVPSEAVAVLEASPLVAVQAPGIFLPLQTVDALDLIGADRWQSAGFSGFGTRVAVVDAGFQGYSLTLGQNLPTRVRVRSFRADGQINAGTDHGRRAAEVIHRVAPGATLFLVNFSTVTELSEAVDYLIAERVDVVSFSLGYIHNGPGDGTGPVNEIVSRAVAAGQAWAVASGNWAQQHWVGEFRDTDGDAAHEFAGMNEVNEHDFAAGDLITVSLRWDEPWGAACSDYDLELFGPNGALVRASRRIQNCAQDPVESLQVLATQTGTYGVRIIQAHAESPRRLELMMVGTPDRGHPLSISNPESSLSEPADHPGVITVGALTASATRTEAPYSSRGPTSDGRFKPNVLAPTGAGNASPAAAFGGTSAAAPHLAGVLAMLKQANPGADAARLAALVQTRAVSVPSVPGGSGARRVDLGLLSGLGPLLPQRSESAQLLGDIPASGLALLQYDGPDGYPVRFIHRLTGYQTVTGVYTLDLARQTWRAYIPGAPDFVNRDLVRVDDGTVLVVRLS
ncbi:MAG: S8 family serine peptidase [Dehalococcoidia bacterium]|nr:S8 family serine peptidase [Dehalococcoidia bacterium]